MTKSSFPGRATLGGRKAFLMDLTACLSQSQEGDSGIALHSHRHRGKTHTRIHHLAHYFNGGDASTAEEDSSKAGSGTSEHRAEAAEARETRETSKAEEKGADLSFREDSTDHKTDSKDGDNDGSDGSDSKVSATRKTAEKDEEAASEGSKESKDSEKSSETSKAAGDRLKHLEYSDADPDRLSKEVTQVIWCARRAANIVLPPVTIIVFTKRHCPPHSQTC